MAIGFVAVRIRCRWSWFGVTGHWFGVAVVPGLGESQPAGVGVDRRPTVHLYDLARAMHASDRSVSIDTSARPMVVSIAGEFDLAAVETVRTALQPMLAHAAVVDLGATTFMDSSGLQCLFALRSQAAQLGGRLTVGAVSPMVRRLFELTGVADELDATD
jgi:anti-anti-sigma factor